jgi:hypothetical protein
MRLSAGATSLSTIAGLELAGETGIEDMRGRVGGMWAAEPPSAVLTLTSGDIATIISSVEFEFSISSGKTAGVSEGCSKPDAEGSCESGVQLI